MRGRRKADLCRPCSVEHRARRVRPGVGAARPPVRAVCGRQQHLRSQPTGGGTSDGEHDAIHHDEAQAQGEPAEECGGASPGNGSFWASASRESGHRKRRIAPKAVQRFKERVRELTSRTRGVSIERMAEELTRYLRGWIGYFGKCETPSVLEGLERVDPAQASVCDLEAVEAGIGAVCRAAETGRGQRSRRHKRRAALMVRGGWRTSQALAFALPNAYFDSLGIPRLTGRR